MAEGSINRRAILTAGAVALSGLAVARATGGEVDEAKKEESGKTPKVATLSLTLKNFTAKVEESGEKFYIPDLYYDLAPPLVLANLAKDKSVASQLYNLPNGLWVLVTVEIGGGTFAADIKDLLTNPSAYDCGQLTFVRYYGKALQPVNMKREPVDKKATPYWSIVHVGGDLNININIDYGANNSKVIW